MCHFVLPCARGKKRKKHGLNELVPVARKRKNRRGGTQGVVWLVRKKGQAHFMQDHLCPT